MVDWVVDTTNLTDDVFETELGRTCPTASATGETSSGNSLDRDVCIPLCTTRLDVFGVPQTVSLHCCSASSTDSCRPIQSPSSCDHVTGLQLVTELVFVSFALAAQLALVTVELAVEQTFGDVIVRIRRTWPHEWNCACARQHGLHVSHVARFKHSSFRHLVLLLDANYATQA